MAGISGSPEAFTPLRLLVYEMLDLVEVNYKVDTRNMHHQMLLDEVIVANYLQQIPGNILFRHQTRKRLGQLKSHVFTNQSSSAFKS